jgi:hypothetical protein
LSNDNDEICEFIFFFNSPIFYLIQESSLFVSKRKLNFEYFIHSCHLISAICAEQKKRKKEKEGKMKKQKERNEN